MKTHRVMFAAIVAVSTSAFSAGPAQSPAPLRVADIVAHMESNFRGAEVTAIQLDASDNKPAHYHVQFRYPENRFVSFDGDQAVARSSVWSTGCSGFDWIRASPDESGLDFSQRVRIAFV